MPDPTGNAIVTTELTKRYGDLVAVDRLDLVVRRGEIFGVLGPNGAGKTTTILMLLGLTEPTSGAALVAGTDPGRDPLEVKRQVGYLPDNAGFYATLTGRQNLRYTARLNRLRPEVAEPRIDGLLADLGLADRADDRVGTYSRGMRQRLGIADTLVKEPQILILDEPTVGIDPAGIDAMFALLRRVRTERDVTIMISSHLLDQVEDFCDRIGIFNQGRLVAVGAVSELATGNAGAFEIDIEVDAGPVAETAIEALLAAVPGVVAVRGGGPTWTLTSATDVRRDLFHTLATVRVPLLSLEVRREHLPEVYRRYFTTESR